MAVAQQDAARASRVSVDTQALLTLGGTCGSTGSPEALSSPGGCAAPVEAASPVCRVNPRTPRLQIQATGIGTLMVLGSGIPVPMTAGTGMTPSTSRWGRSSIPTLTGGSGVLRPGRGRAGGLRAHTSVTRMLPLCVGACRAAG